MQEGQRFHIGGVSAGDVPSHAEENPLQLIVTIAVNTCGISGDNPCRTKLWVMTIFFFPFRQTMHKKQDLKADVAPAVTGTADLCVLLHETRARGLA